MFNYNNIPKYFSDYFSNEHEKFEEDNIKDKENKFNELMKSIKNVNKEDTIRE